MGSLQHAGIVLIAIALAVVAGAVYGQQVCAGPVPAKEDMADALVRIQASVDGRLDRIDRNVAEAALAVPISGITGPGTRDALANLSASDPEIISAVAIDNNGIIRAAEPAWWQKYEGSDISGQLHIIRLMQTRQAQMSPVFHSVEGFEAVAIVYPVFSGNGSLIGAVSALFDPGDLLSAEILPVITGTRLSATVIQDDTRVLFDTDPGEIGAYGSTDSRYQVYPEIQALVARMARERWGEGSYSYPPPGSDRPVTKKAAWSTAGLHGTDWRVAVTRISP